MITSNKQLKVGQRIKLKSIEQIQKEFNTDYLTFYKDTDKNFGGIGITSSMFRYFDKYHIIRKIREDYLNYFYLDGITYTFDIRWVVNTNKYNKRNIKIKIKLDD